MDGILIIDKPVGLTSHDVVARVRRTLHTKKVGHTGTLDPFATGVMVILVGKATRLAQFLDKDEKRYVARVRFGSVSDTGDLTGSIKRVISDQEVADILKNTDLSELAGKYTGEIDQVPPMYSAKKIGGKKLYELARQRQEIEREAVKVSIHSLTIDRDPQEPVEAVMTVKCSAGTYIRTLAEDIGNSIGCGGYLTELRRTAAGKFSIDQGRTLESLAQMSDPGGALLPIDEALSTVPGFTLTPERVGKTLNGMSTRVPPDTFEPNATLKMLSPDGDVVAIGTYISEDSCIQPKIALV